MAKSVDIDKLLLARPSEATAQSLVKWADETRSHIVRGDMMIGILSSDEVAKIPSAYRRAAQTGKPAAWIALAKWYASPGHGDQDLDSAESALQSAIDAEVENARLELVKFCWFHTRETATNAERNRAFQMVSAIIEAQPTNAEAIYIQALLITQGFGIVPSPSKGFELQRRAADLGNANAMFELYIHHARGLGVPADEFAAFQVCQRAAEAGHSSAMFNLGAFNASGRGVPKNIPEAIEWYERSADAGNPSAMAGLAAIYAAGDGVEGLDTENRDDTAAR